MDRQLDLAAALREHRRRLRRPCGCDDDNTCPQHWQTLPAWQRTQADRACRPPQG